MEFPEEMKIRELSYSIKMIISKEIEQEKLRRLECSMLRNASNLITTDDLPAEDADTFEESVPELSAIPEGKDDSVLLICQNGSLVNEFLRFLFCCTDCEDVSSQPITPNRVKSTQNHTPKSSNKENLSQNHLQKLTPKAIKPTAPASVSRVSGCSDERLSKSFFSFGGNLVQILCSRFINTARSSKSLISHFLSSYDKSFGMSIGSRGLRGEYLSYFVKYLEYG